MLSTGFSFAPLILFSILPRFTIAADCSQSRKEGDPSGQQIADAITKNNALSSVCSGNFSPSSQTDITYNYWSMLMTVHRDDPNQPLQNCEDGMNNIISQCITDGNSWGGEWSLNGFKYTISNSIYDQSPNNPLAPGDAGGPSAGASSSTPADTSSSSAPASPPDGATTITETIKGSEVVATFVPTTLSEYATLQSATTITTTTTDSNGEAVIFPWVIAAGGIAFIPWAAAGAIPPGITPPPVAPGDSGGDGPQTNDATTTTSDTTTASSSSSSSSSSSQSCMRDLTFAGAAGTRYEGFKIPAWVTRSPTKTSSTSSSTRSTPPPQTATYNCQRCVLVYGSNHPVCTPIEGCTPTTSTTSTPPPDPGPTGTMYPGCGDVDVSGFSCGNNCRGFVACQPWCVDNCAYCFNAHTVC